VRFCQLGEGQKLLQIQSLESQFPPIFPEKGFGYQKMFFSYLKRILSVFSRAFYLSKWPKAFFTKKEEN